jgi:membrane-associated phospholipid phosphatase
LFTLDLFQGRFPLFGVMLYGRRVLQTGRGMSTSNDAAPRTFAPGIFFAALWALAQRIPANLTRWIMVLVRPPRARPPRWPVNAWVALVLAVAVIFGSMVFVDTAASSWARHLPPQLIDVADQITNFGRSGWFLYPLGFILLCVAAVMAPALPRRTQGTLAALAARLSFLFIAIGLPGLFATIVKRLIGRARPYVGLQDDPFAYMPFIWRPEYASMPSGHATTATAAAIAIGAIWPRSRLVMWLYAVIILFTRVAINVHHPSDVIAGALVGVVGALLVRRFFAARRLVFCAGDLRPYPWPSFKRIKAAAGDVRDRALADFSAN